MAEATSGDPSAPCIMRRREERRKKKGEVLHLFRCYTHTPGRSRVNPERQEEEKSGHRRRAKGQNSAGGVRERTDLQNQPYGEARGKKGIRDQMGDRGQVVPQWHKQLYEFQRIRCTICSTSPNTKETTPAGKGHACCRTCHVELRKLELQWQKRSFWQFRLASHWQKCIP